jgi:hypothetical protein
VSLPQPEQNERKEKREESAARGGVVYVFGFIIFPFQPLFKPTNSVLPLQIIILPVVHLWADNLLIEQKNLNNG